MRGRLRRLPIAATLLVGVCAAALGCRQQEPPLTSADRLAKARVAEEAGDAATRDRHLLIVSAGSDEDARIATTWRLQVALSNGDVVAALPMLRRIVEVFGGRGLSKDGVEHLQDTLAPVVVAEGAAAARRFVEGPKPDLAKAEEALEAGREAVKLGGVDEEDRAPLEAATKYVALSKGPVDLTGLVKSPDAGSAPRVVVFADDFQMGEPVLPSVMRRWKRGLPVHLVGLLSGSVRRGIRREPTSPHEERIALADRAKDLDVAFEGAVREDAEAVRRLGLDVKSATVFVLRADGSILARAAGRSLDARVLDAVVVPLAPAAAPEK
jgi:hypothetical protein